MANTEVPANVLLAGSIAIPATLIGAAELGPIIVPAVAKAYKEGQKRWRGREIKISPDLRIAPFGNRRQPGTRWYGLLPHYHRRKPGVPGQGIGRHRPWETKSTDKSFWDRF